MSEPLGYLLTWTCYGTWLHGDERGSVDRDHNTPRAEFLPPDQTRLFFEARGLSHRSVRLNAAGRRIVDETIAAHCTIRSWELHAVNVRTNHVHVVLSCDTHPKTAMKQVKSWTTRRLRENGITAPNATVWTDGGSRIWLWNRESLRRAIEYVSDFQGEDLP